MNPWDFVTWLAAFALAITAAVIFGFFLRDARSIFERKMHDEDEASNEPQASASAAAETRPPK